MLKVYECIIISSFVFPFLFIALSLSIKNAVGVSNPQTFSEIFGVFFIFNFTSALEHNRLRNFVHPHFNDYLLLAWFLVFTVFSLIAWLQSARFYKKIEDTHYIETCERCRSRPPDGLVRILPVSKFFVMLTFSFCTVFFFLFDSLPFILKYPLR